VGVNRHVEEEAGEVEILRIDPRLERRQIERVRALRERRDGQRAAAALARLEADARGDANLMPAILEAARADATMGEMCDTLRGVWGTWRESPVF
jgi:methylmalonyl-CoA mutase N-terminal domain/subunit